MFPGPTNGRIVKCYIDDTKYLNNWMSLKILVEELDIVDHPQRSYKGKFYFSNPQSLCNDTYSDPVWVTPLKDQIKNL